MRPGTLFCDVLSGETFLISEARAGENLAPLHPNCDCGAEILDETGNVVYAFGGKDENNPPQAEAGEQNELSELTEYIIKSLKQVILGNYTDDVTLLGTAGQVGLGIIGVDLPGDVRDLVYDIQNWDWTWKHAGLTALDAISLIPVVGALKYSDEAWAILKNASKLTDTLKHSDETADALKASGHVLDDAIDTLKEGRKLVDEAIDAVKEGKQLDEAAETGDLVKGAGKANPKGIKINVGKQDKHIPGTNNYKQSVASGANRSTLAENPQQLLDDFAGTGQKIPNTNKERVDFGKVIGQYYDPKTNTYIDTTRGLIHYDSKGGAHIVPAPPNGYR